MATIYHGTSADFTGYPVAHTDGWGRKGVFFTADKKTAIDYATSIDTHGDTDGTPRIFVAEIKDGAEIIDLTSDEYDDYYNSGLEDADIIEELEADIAILPDTAGDGSTDEYLVVWHPAIEWIGVEQIAA